MSTDGTVLSLGDALRKLFRVVDSASQRIRQFENEEIPALHADIAGK